MSDPSTLPLVNLEWRRVLLQHCARALAEGREEQVIAFLQPSGNGEIDQVNEARYADEVPPNAVVISMFSGPIERRLDAVGWPDCDPNTGELLGEPIVIDAELHVEMFRHADRLWRAWRDVQIRRRQCDES